MMTDNLRSVLSASRPVSSGCSLTVQAGRRKSNVRRDSMRQAVLPESAKVGSAMMDHTSHNTINGAGA